MLSYAHSNIMKSRQSETKLLILNEAPSNHSCQSPLSKETKEERLSTQTSTCGAHSDQVLKENPETRMKVRKSTTTSQLEKKNFLKKHLNMNVAQLTPSQGLQKLTSVPQRLSEEHHHL